MASPKLTFARSRSLARPPLTRRAVPGQRSPSPLPHAQMAAALQRALQPRAALSAADLRVLQRAGGNQAVQRLLAQRGQARLPLAQAKLTVGAAGDAYEREADRIAALIAGPARAPARAGHSPASSGIRRQPAQGAPIGAEGGPVPGSLERRVAAGGGRPMPEKVRGVLESRLGLDLSPVRVHTDANAVQLNQEFGAQAFTHQNHIFYGPGQSPDDLALTAHETVHTIQQGAVGPGPGSGGAGIQRKFGLEVELGIFMNSGAGVKNADTGSMQYAPPVLKKHPVVAQNPAKSLELHEETGSSGTPKVELVSNPPHNEFKEDEAAVKAKLGAMRDFARSAQSKTNGFKDRIPLNTVMPEAGPENFLGSESPSASLVQNVNGNLQATYGVRLDRVKALFDLQSQPATEESAPTANASESTIANGPPPPPGPPPPMASKKDKGEDSAKYLKQAMEQTERLVAALQLEALQPDGRDIVSNWVAHTNRTSWLGKDKKRSIGLQNLDGLVAQLGSARANYDRDTLTQALNGVQTALSGWRRGKATWYGAARESMREAEARELEAEANRIHDLLNDLLTGQKTAELEGFLALICNYLLAGKDAKGIGWGKNKVGQLFYKSKLSSVRLNLTGAIDSTIKDKPEHIRGLIQKETGRASSDGVLTGGPVKVKNWLSEILAGSGDPMFDSLKNEYADEIAPKDEWLTETGDTMKGVVAENRQLSLLMKVGQQPEDWVTTGLKLYRMLRMVNGLLPPVIGDVRAVLNESS